MSTYALIDENNIVINTVVCEPENASILESICSLAINVDGIRVGLGWIYDPNTEEFTAPQEE